MSLSVRIPMPQFIDGDGNFVVERDGKWYQYGSSILSTSPVVVEVGADAEIRLSCGDQPTLIRLSKPKEGV